MMGKSRFDIPRAEIEAFCEKYDIKEFSLFGSVLLDDFSKDSDIDILVTFSKNSRHTVFDLVRMEEELEQIEKEIKEEVKSAHKKALAAPDPTPDSIFNFILPEPYKPEKYKDRTHNEQGEKKRPPFSGTCGLLVPNFVVLPASWRQ